MFTLSEINVARTVSQLGSIQAAAKALHKTQPAISQAIKRLEDKVGFELFDRTGYRVSLTSKGNDFIQQCEFLLDQEVRLRKYAKLLCQGQESKLTISAAPVLQEELLYPLLKEVNRRFPDTTIFVDFEESMGALEQLVKGVANLAICPFQRINKSYSSIEAYRVAEVQYVNVISASLIGQMPPESVGWEDLANWHQISIRNAHSGISYSFGADRGGLRWEVNDQRLTEMLIREGLGWGMIPLPWVEAELASGELVELKIPDLGSRITANIVAGRLQGKEMGPVAAFIWNRLMEMRISEEVVI